MKTLSDFKFKNKVVLLRADLNSDIKNGKVLWNERFRESSETIKELKKKGAKIIILAHQGRPGKKDFISLKQHAKLMGIEFVEDIIGKKAEDAITNLKKGDVIILDNVRKLKEEFKPGKNKLVEFFMGKVDIYVNDAFSVCHRKQTSIVSFPKYFPSCAGRVLEKEVKALKKVNLKDCLYILGGAKPEDNIKLLGKNKVLATGFFGQLCLISQGIEFGEHEKFLRKMLGKEFEVVKKLKNKMNNVLTPVDYAVKAAGRRVELSLGEFPSGFAIYDIGEKTMDLFAKEIKKAKAIYVKGPSGDCRERQFCNGTVAILEAVSRAKGFSLIGGGHLNDVIDISGIPRKKFGHISLSGGALLSYLAGEKLLGLEALK
ncbi:MAG: phosphoglycerate kinase [Nanoarchaeota archaeon]|nr:phosphoglycerate kinase [Nanoarchaeota archaeon]